MGWLMEDFNSFFLLKIKKEAGVYYDFVGTAFREVFSTRETNQGNKGGNDSQKSRKRMDGFYFVLCNADRHV
jgi:hypothetical protein